MSGDLLLGRGEDTDSFRGLVERNFICASNVGRRKVCPNTHNPMIALSQDITIDVVKSTKTECCWPTELRVYVCIYNQKCVKRQMEHRFSRMF